MFDGGGADVGAGQVGTVQVGPARVRSGKRLAGSLRGAVELSVAGAVSAVVADKAVFTASASLAIAALAVCRPWSLGLLSKPATEDQAGERAQEVPS